jgi:hypothetical protein
VCVLQLARFWSEAERYIFESPAWSLTAVTGTQRRQDPGGRCAEEKRRCAIQKLHIPPRPKSCGWLSRLHSQRLCGLRRWDSMPRFRDPKILLRNHLGIVLPRNRTDNAIRAQPDCIEAALGICPRNTVIATDRDRHRALGEESRIKSDGIETWGSRPC